MSDASGAVAQVQPKAQRNLDRQHVQAQQTLFRT